MLSSKATLLIAVAVAAPAGAGAGPLPSRPAPPQAEVRRVELRTRDLGVPFDFVYGDPERPYVVDAGGTGAAWLDYDVDGRLDLILLNGLPGPSTEPAQATRAALAGTPLAASLRADGTLPHHLLLRGGGDPYETAPASAGLAEAAWSSAAVAADLDNDGFDDLYVTAIGPNRWYRNNGDGTFSAQQIGIEDDGYGTGVALVQWSSASRLDLYLANYVEFDSSTTGKLGDGQCNYLGVPVFCGPVGLVGQRDVLYRNTGQSRFEVWPGAAIDTEAGFGFAALPFDCNGDLEPEIYVANDSNMNLLYEHTADGIEDLSLFSGAGFSGSGLEQAGMGVTSADVDGDGDFDLVVANFQHDYNTLYENLGDCSFLDVTADRGLAAAAYPYMGWSPLLVDIDGDGDRDLFVTDGHLYPQLADLGLEPFGQRNLLFLNQLRETGAATFEQVGDEAGPGLALAETSRSSIWGDFDNDGDIDLLTTQLDGPPRLLVNESTPRLPALRLTLVGRQANRGALGAVVKVVSGGVEQWLEVHRGDGYLGTSDARLLVYLPGNATSSVEVHWPGGDWESLGALQAGTAVVQQGRGVIARRAW